MQSGFVCVFSNPGLSAYKVGYIRRARYTSGPRNCTANTARCSPSRSPAVTSVDEPPVVEALAHRILARHRVRRYELFACSQAKCVRAIKAAAILVLARPWWLRCWHWVTLPRPVARRRPGRYRRASGAGSLLFLLSVVALAALLVHFQPTLPPWFPSSVIRSAYLLERFRR